MRRFSQARQAASPFPTPTSFDALTLPQSTAQGLVFSLNLNFSEQFLERHRSEEHTPTSKSGG